MYKDKVLEYYYKNREKRILYQRKYDKENKEKKNKYEREKRRGIRYNQIKRVQHYSERNHLPILLKTKKKCEFCGNQENLQIHHKKYTKKINDCLLLCSKCHKKIHRKIYI